MSVRERLLRNGYPPAYAEGFEAGYSGEVHFLCSREFDSLINKEGGTMDANRYAKDRSYAQGWDDGCERNREQALDELNQAEFIGESFDLQQELLKRNDD